MVSTGMPWAEAAEGVNADKKRPMLTNLVRIFITALHSQAEGLRQFGHRSR
jgi:hypothetical protein